MIETEWLACDNPKTMLDFLGKRASKRKLRLFACACCRTQWDQLLDDDVRKTVSAAERYADGLIRDSTVTSWYRRTMHARDRLRSSDYSLGELYQAVIEAALPDQYLDRVAMTYWHVAAAGASATAARHWDAAALQAAQEKVLATFAPLLRDILGNPFHTVALDPLWMTWNDGTIPKLAQAIYDERAHDRLPILGDALEDAGCTDTEILSHCRGPGPHVRGCWIVDLLLGLA
jgi:hypothetical protein